MAAPRTEVSGATPVRAGAARLSQGALYERVAERLRERILARFCCLAAAITLNHQLGRPSRALVNYCA